MKQINKYQLALQYTSKIWNEYLAKRYADRLRNHWKKEILIKAFDSQYWKENTKVLVYDLLEGDKKLKF